VGIIILDFLHIISAFIVVFLIWLPTEPMIYLRWRLKVTPRLNWSAIWGPLPLLRNPLLRLPS
jgi:hypothetical protein